MGSGRYANGGYGNSAFAKNIVYSLSTTVTANYTGTIITSVANCYDLAVFTPGTTWGSGFYLGGPGYNPGYCVTP